MNLISDLAIEQFIFQFTNKTLPKVEWTHKAHLLAAMWFNHKLPFNEALQTMRGHIISYNESVGTQNTESSGYHETLTIFWMILIRNFIDQNERTSISDCYQAFLTSPFADKLNCMQFYSRQILFSKEARAKWMNGDIKPVTLENKETLIGGHYALSDTQFAEQFQSQQLDPVLFSHEAHLRLAWIYLNKYGLKLAEEKVCQQIKDYVIHLDAVDKFHFTLTMAAVNAVNHFVQLSNSDNFFDFSLEFPQLKYQFKDLIQSHYSINIFTSEEAKQSFIAPDLVSFQ